MVLAPAVTEQGATVPILRRTGAGIEGDRPGRQNGGVRPTRFGTREALTAAELWSAPVHLAKPSALTAQLDIKPAKAKQAAAGMGLVTVGDLLEHLPRDRGSARTIAELQPGEKATVVAEVRTITSRPVQRRGMKPLVNAVVGDASGVMEATFFNQPWLVKRYPAGTRLLLSGTYKARNRFAVTAHAPTTSGLGADGDVEQGVAIYPATDGLSSTQILELVRAHQHAFAAIGEPLPSALRTAERLPDRAAAVRACHEAQDTEPGRRRLAFDELLHTQLVLLRNRAVKEAGARALALEGPRELTARWIEQTLPFTPTDDQARAMDEIDAAIARSVPMQRLLMGEVGSGKTVVAVHAMLRAVEHGAQAALMAPTETLAEQHFITLQSLLPDAFVSAALLTGSTPAGRRRELLGRLASGELQLVVGTHALIEDPVVFDRLAVVVVDEQHRFGVRQRRALDRKGPGDRVPHVLHMTATPIPRTLALTAYGDLDVTALKHLPRGRQPIATHVAFSAAERHRAYDRIREELEGGRQAFVVCPLVEVSEALEARAATEEHARLQRDVFPEYDLALLHGRMTPAEKQAAMERFAAGAADVLVSTTVIEVGIDVPNASVMLVEDAERFGISQLHQLRGRVGRGPHPSVCILFGPKESKRLQALERHTDGFRLAEIDLELRGEGELVGTRQSGMAAFKHARLPDDADLLERVRVHAGALLADDPDLAAPEHALLALAHAELLGTDAPEPIPA